jgi:hypothetical protein
MDLKWLLSATPYGNTWRRSRKLLHTHVHQGISPKYHSTQLDAARRFVHEILNAKQDTEVLPYTIRTHFGRMITKIVYGIDVSDSESEYITLPEKVISNISEASIPGRFLVDFFPMCKCLTWLRSWARDHE